MLVVCFFTAETTCWQEFGISFGVPTGDAAIIKALVSNRILLCSFGVLCLRNKRWAFLHDQLSVGWSLLHAGPQSRAQAISIWYPNRSSAAFLSGP